MANWQHCPALERDKQRNSGLWVFKGTDVPLFRLYETLVSGSTISEFAQGSGVERGLTASLLDYEAEDFRADLLIRPDGPGAIAPIPPVAPIGSEIPDWSFCSVVERVAGKESGAWIFTESRLPLWAMYSEMAAGATIDEFADWYGGNRTKVVTMLEHEAEALWAESTTIWKFR